MAYSILLFLPFLSPNLCYAFMFSGKNLGGRRKKYLTKDLTPNNFNM